MPTWEWIETKPDLNVRFCLVSNNEKTNLIKKIIINKQQQTRELLMKQTEVDSHGYKTAADMLRNITPIFISFASLRLFLTHRPAAAWGVPKALQCRSMSLQQVHSASCQWDKCHLWGESRANSLSPPCRTNNGSQLLANKKAEYWNPLRTQWQKRLREPGVCDLVRSLQM